MTGEIINEIERILIVCVERINRICIRIEHFEYDTALREIPLFTKNIQTLLQKVVETETELREMDLLPDYSYLIACISEINEAQENGDFVYLDDVLHCKLYPFFSNLLIMYQQVWEYREQGALEANLEALKELQPELYELLLKIKDNIELSPDYLFESTNSGMQTIKKLEAGGSYYIYSNDNPRANIVRWTKNELKLSDDELHKAEIREYHVLGFDLGYVYMGLDYHTKGLYPIHCYETDPAMLIYALSLRDYSGAFKRNLVLHLDPLLTEFASHMKEKQSKVLLYPPRVRMIENAEIRSSYMKYLVAQSSVREQAVLLNGNFIKNQSMDDVKNVDSLSGCFAGKDIYIVAAGPSLDKNFMELKEVAKEDNALIVATGTVFRKLMKAGIRPDYVIISEANERVKGQIDGFENENVPMLLLSTATHVLYTTYQGPKYKIYQYEFAPAEKAAIEEGCRLYMTGGSVSTTACDVAIRLGAGRIIFLGLDLAFTDDLSHSLDTSRRDFVDSGNLTMILGYDGKEVKADSKFMLYIDWFKRRLKMDDIDKIEIIDATEGGAIIPGMKCMTLAEAISG